MRLQAEIALLFIINLIWIPHIICDGVSTKSEMNNWTCTCSLARHGNLNFIPASCSSFCDCSPDARGSSEDRWTCLCAAYGLPKLAAADNNGSCFASCNCNSGNSRLQNLL